VALAKNYRHHPLNQKPLCFDAEGTATVLPRTLQVGELLRAGKPMSDIDAEIAEGLIICRNIDKKQMNTRNELGLRDIKQHG
jgi:hypothetical protein